MPANQTRRRKEKRAVVTLRKSFEDVSEEIDALADALEDGEADEELVSETVRQLAAAAVSISDAAETADVIDGHAAEWRAINELRAAMYHTADAIRLEADPSDAVISPSPADSRSAALSDATAGAEYLDLARDEQREADR